MKAPLLVLAICVLQVSAQKPHATVTTSLQPAARVSNSFSFTVNAPLRNAAPLFGAEGERVWAGEEWNPQFVFPVPARDIEGAVFTVQHGAHMAVWVNTLFDLGGGRMQYVYTLGDLLVTTIDVRLHPIDARHTKVEVTYVRTALQPEANGHVAALGKHDREQGPDWEKAINSYLKGRAKRP